MLIIPYSEFVYEKPKINHNSIERNRNNEKKIKVKTKKVKSEKNKKINVY